MCFSSEIGRCGRTWEGEKRWVRSKIQRVDGRWGERREMIRVLIKGR